jgi:small subunit ribosomal protein S6
MKLYEGMFLFDSNLAVKDWPGLENHVREILTKNGAELVYAEHWPDRKLYYEIKGCKKGTYYLTYFRAPLGAVQGIQHDTELSERILRLLVIHDEELESDCEKRIKKEITGSPEEIAAKRESARLAAEGALQAAAAASAPVAPGAAAPVPEASAPAAEAGAAVPEGGPAIP